MKVTAEPRSDQWNATDFIVGPKTFIIASVKVGAADAKYDIGLLGEERCWRPPLTMLRLLMAAWGDEGNVWIGRMVTLFHDPTVRNMGAVVGGIRVSHMSDLPGNKPFEVNLPESQTKKAIVRALPLAPIDALRTEWRTADDNRRAEIEAEIKATNQPKEVTP
jgi:hypothetical protein